MQCQTCCPENKIVRNWSETRGEFQEEETAMLLRQIPFDRLPGETKKKLRSLEINEEYRCLCRNLSMILEQ